MVYIGLVMLKVTNWGLQIFFYSFCFNFEYNSHLVRVLLSMCIVTLGEARTKTIHPPVIYIILFSFNGRSNRRSVTRTDAHRERFVSTIIGIKSEKENRYMLPRKYRNICTYSKLFAVKCAIFPFEINKQVNDINAWV